METSFSTETAHFHGNTSLLSRRSLDTKSEAPYICLYLSGTTLVRFYPGRHTPFSFPLFSVQTPVDCTEAQIYSNVKCLFVQKRLRETAWIRAASCIEIRTSEYYNTIGSVCRSVGKLGRRTNSTNGVCRELLLHRPPTTLAVHECRLTRRQWEFDGIG